MPYGKSTELPTGPSGEKEPDRVIFTFDGSRLVTKGGTTTYNPHEETDAGRTGSFVMCIEGGV